MMQVILNNLYKNNFELAPTVRTTSFSNKDIEWEQLFGEVELKFDINKHQMDIDAFPLFSKILDKYAFLGQTIYQAAEEITNLENQVNFDKALNILQNCKNLLKDRKKFEILDGFWHETSLALLIVELKIKLGIFDLHKETFIFDKFLAKISKTNLQWLVLFREIKKIECFVLLNQGRLKECYQSHSLQKGNYLTV